ncbi:1-deoxy-D-xylulose 5-phosphate reductoisomerase [Pirellulimonas nuda]|uniref:1-deoxy-D-xylulose 5-phosphate reductoisomerase n=1 Tax=Pirellulimonas nuda TaxID=2528009 RepID=A0A518D5G3_9BACT|nr:1-deoxy-D-xylulose-5-phosphate reductoisomerase [Pirellulimonas nuda]QDU86699.1 1-deoxy-D-xylulose 5-phosphate reductoisomerase [Pirellulimonas nuda]
MNLSAATPRRVAVLGSTGSVGRSALEVIAASGGRLRVEVLSGCGNLDLLAEQARQFNPHTVVAADRKKADARKWRDLPEGCRLLTGPEGLAEAAGLPAVDVVLAAIVGAAGLQSTWAALEAGKTVALANKETLVTAGPLVQQLIEKTPGARLIPVDSEHSAVFQALQAGKRDEVAKVVLTASGGPFRTWPADALRQVTIEEALAHPTWEMGPKITIDSATMMNKALEIIEARWLFDLQADQLDVMIHPQSIIHSLVEFVDGSIVAQMSPPDMRLPIQYALEFPERRAAVAERFDWTRAWNLELEPADHERFPALALGFECAAAGGSSGAVLSAANEAAVESFLEGDLHFTEIVPACRSVLESHNFEADPTLEDLARLDRWARAEVQSWVLA